MTKRSIILFVQTRDSKDIHQIEGYIGSSTIETKGFFTYFDNEEKIHIIPTENVEYFAINYSLVEYTNMEGLGKDKERVDHLINCKYTIDTNKDKVMDITDCFSVTKGSKFVIFDTFGEECINRIFIPIRAIKDIAINDETTDNPARYKATLLFDPKVLRAAAGKDNDYRVLDIFKNLKPAGITEAEVVQLYKARFYDLDILPEAIAKGLDTYINHADEIPEEDDVPEAGKVQNTEPDEEYKTPDGDNTLKTHPGFKVPPTVAEGTEMTDEELDKAIEEQLEVPDRSDKKKSEEELIGKSLSESHKDLYDEVTSEFKTELTRLKAFSKYRFQQELANDHLIKANNPNYESYLLNIEEVYYDILRETDPDIDISFEDPSFKDSLYDYVQAL
jgi:hypothetical protein|nr:MAG TPA: hypothetical protein [Caudoviricetes sp.]